MHDGDGGRGPATMAGVDQPLSSGPAPLRRRLEQLRARVAALRAKLPVEREQLEEDELLEWTITRGLSLAADAVVDVGAALLDRAPEAAASAPAALLDELAATGVVWPETAGRLRGLPGLRDAIVPDDVVLDHVRLLDALGRLDAFEAFAAEVEAWLDRREVH